MRKLGVRARWAVPAGVVGTVGIVIAASAVASAESAPSLPARSAAQLLAGMARASAKPLGPLTATVQQTSDLGLPSLPAAATGGSGVPAALAGGQTVTIWYRDARHIRLAVPVQAGESDLRLAGRTLWLWNSKTQTATRVALPAHFSGLRDFAGNGAGKPPAASAAGGAALPDSPLAAANQVLAAIGPSTAVIVQRNLYVAGRAAYQLSVVPRASGSLIGKILIAIDASRHIPLRVQVFARGASSPAFGVGFTALTFGAPSASNFSFTPPPGATVKKVTVPAKLPGLGGRLALGKLGAAAAGPVAVKGAMPYKLAKLPKSGAKMPKQVIRQIELKFASSLPATMPKAARAKAIKAFDKQLSKGFMPGSMAVLKASAKGNNGGGSINVRKSALGIAAGSPFGGVLPASLTGVKPAVIGSDWLSVVATSPNPAVAAVVKGLLANAAGDGRAAVFQQSSSSGSSALSSTLTIHMARVGPGLAALRALLLATRPVHGSWGRGRLLTTSLVSVLITSNGRILAGLVTPAVLYHDAAAPAR